MTNSLRDYNNLVERFLNLKKKFQIKIYINEFQCNDYPLFELALPAKSQATKKVPITAGIHGDEPAGVETILKFLEQKNSNLS